MHLEAVKIAALGWQQRADAQEQVLADLRAQLQEEIQAQQALAAQGTTLSTEKTTAPQPPNGFMLRKKPGSRKVDNFGTLCTHYTCCTHRVLTI